MAVPGGSVSCSDKGFPSHKLGTDQNLLPITK